MNTDEIRTVKEQLDRIETCLVGDPKMGHRGLVASRDNHEKRITALERVVLYGMGAGLAVSGIVGAVHFLKDVLGP